MNIELVEQYIFPEEDFAKSLLPFSQQSTPSLLCITQTNKLLQFSIENQHLSLRNDLQFESVLYDAQVLKDVFITSCKDMPVRIHCMLTGQCLGAISDRKQNSERYLAPLSMKVAEGAVAYGVGRKFMSEYDFEKCYRSNRFAQFDKKYLSSIALQNQQIANYTNLAVVGDFVGQLSIVDLNTKSTICSSKTHVDGITDIKFHPDDNNLFVSSARCDNFKYIWDTRMLDRFVRFFEVPNKTNQRINFELKGNMLFTGDQFGYFKIFEIQTGQLLKNAKLYQKSLNWISSHEKSLFMASGQRNFEQNQGPVSSGKLGIYNCM